MRCAGLCGCDGGMRAGYCRGGRWLREFGWVRGSLGGCADIWVAAREFGWLRGRWAKELFPVRCSVSEKQEVLSSLLQGAWYRTDRRTIRHPWLACAFLGHPCPKILVFWQKAKNLQLFSKVTPERNRFSTQLVPAQAQLPIPVRPLPGFIFLCLAQVLKFLCMPPLLGLLCCFWLNL